MCPPEQTFERGLQQTPVALDPQRARHLKSLCSLVVPTLLIHDPARLDPAPFVEAGLEVLAADEPWDANVLALGDHGLVSSAAPRTLATLRARGLAAHATEIDECDKADDAFTCLSIRIPAPGTWVT